jgi:hypothetical protein
MREEVGMRAITFVRLTFCGLGLGVSIFGFAGLAQGQSLMENAAAAAGGSVGGVAGKQVSDGLSTIFGKIDQDTSKAAAKPSKRYTGPSEPLLEAGPGVPKTAARRAANKAANRAESVPPPPPLPTHGPVHKTAAVVPPPVPVIEPPPPPPPPQMTADELHTVTAGMDRGDLLKLGAPASRITMFEDGHLVEYYLYLAKDTKLGEVRLSDGQVAAVELR